MGAGGKEGVVYSVCTSAASVSDVHSCPIYSMGKRERYGATLAMRAKPMRFTRLCRRQRVSVLPVLFDMDQFVEE